MTATKPASAVDDKSLLRLLDRITVLHLCKEALDMGIKLRSLPHPTTPERCGAIVKQMLQRICPDIEGLVRYYAVERIQNYRLTIGRRQVSLCPWMVQVESIRLAKGAITVSRALRVALPVRLGHDQATNVIGGPIGAFAQANGFTLMYRPTSQAGAVFFASSNHPRPTSWDDVAEHVRVMRENLISPAAFCQAMALVYQELKDSFELSVEADAMVREHREGMARIRRQAKSTKTQGALERLEPLVQWKKKNETEPAPAPMEPVFTRKVVKTPGVEDFYKDMRHFDRERRAALQEA